MPSKHYFHSKSLADTKVSFKETKCIHYFLILIITLIKVLDRLLISQYSFNISVLSLYKLSIILDSECIDFTMMYYTQPNSL